MALSERSKIRRKMAVGHRAHGFQDADQWDLEFWQKQGPEMRLSALVAIRRDVAAVKMGKDHA